MFIRYYLTPYLKFGIFLSLPEGFLLSCTGGYVRDRGNHYQGKVMLVHTWRLSSGNAMIDMNGDRGDTAPGTG
jgi:hypothetical protein